MEIDSRAEKLADLVLDYSLGAGPGDRLLVQSDPAFEHYAFLVGDGAKQRGAEVKYDFESHDPAIRRCFLENCESSGWDGELVRRKELASWCNKRILVDCDSNPNYAEGIEDSEVKMGNFSKHVVGPYKDILYRTDKDGMFEVKWNLVGFPYRAGADIAGMTLEDYADFVYSATIGNDWEKMIEDMGKVKQVFDNAEKVRIVVPGLTDLSLSLRDRGGEVCDGRYNMPDGEVCYGPVEDSLNGHIYFQCPTKRAGFGVLEGIRLDFENGVIKDFSAKTNQRALEETLKIPGAKQIGELGIGCNAGIQKITLETLFDEKIGGTIHLALGDSFGQPLDAGGGLNKSDIHWDIICDLRKNLENLAEFPGGEIYVDGKLIQKDGIWKFTA